MGYHIWQLYSCYSFAYIALDSVAADRQATIKYGDFSITVDDSWYLGMVSGSMDAMKCPGGMVNPVGVEDKGKGPLQILGTGFLLEDIGILRVSGT